MEPPALPSAAGTALLLALLVPQAVHAEPAEPARRRHLVLSSLPRGFVPEIRVAGNVSTVLRFESPLDPAGTKLQEESPLLEPLEISGRFLVLHPTPVVGLSPRLPMVVRLMDGTTLPFALVPGAIPEADTQVDVFLHPSSPGALQAALETLTVDHEELESRYATLQAELEHYRQDEHSPDVALATLLLDDEASEHFLKARFIKITSNDARAHFQRVRVAGRSAYVFDVTNRHLSKGWRLTQAALVNETTHEPRPFVVRVRPSIIPPGGSGRIVLVTRSPPKEEKDRYSIQLLAPEGPAWQLCFSGMEL